jgi:uncharacterized protein YecE (DUF72 family)
VVEVALVAGHDAAGLVSHPIPGVLRVGRSRLSAVLRASAILKRGAVRRHCSTQLLGVRHRRRYSGRVRVRARDGVGGSADSDADRADGIGRGHNGYGHRELGYVKAMVVRVGTSGWSYDHWGGVLYEPGLPASQRLACYAAEFDTVELNASFYRWPKETTFSQWRRRLPSGFLMSVKAARGLTHGRRLRSPEVWVDRFTRCWHELGDRRGALLVQTHPAQARDDATLDYLLGALPNWMKVAVEFRHPSWDDPGVYQLLERHQTAYVVMSGAGLRCVLKATAQLVYVRLHGPHPSTLYGGSYSTENLRWWAHRINEWCRGGHDVFVYFNNDGAGNAVRNAGELRTLLTT